MHDRDWFGIISIGAALCCMSMTALRYDIVPMLRSGGQDWMGRAVVVSTKEMTSFDVLMSL
jgi:hypothetical protein